MRRLKSSAQKLHPTVTFGKKGLSEELLAELNSELDRRELVKLRFASAKDQRKELSIEIADKTGASIVSQVGNVVVLYRQNQDEEKRQYELTN